MRRAVSLSSRISSQPRPSETGRSPRCPAALRACGLAATLIATVFPGTTSFAVAPDPLSFSEIDAGPVNRVNVEAYSAAWGDFDNDGRPDLYLSTLLHAPAACFRNTAQGFVAVTDALIGTDVASRAGAVWVDADNDRLLDLFVGTTLAEDDTLYLNRGTSGFARVSAPPFTGSAGYGQSALAFDFNRDGLVDLFVPNGGGWTAEPNLLLRNLGGGAFRRDTIDPAALEVLASAGAAAADYDGDGWPDLFVANIQISNSLFHGRGDGTFDRVTTGPIATEPQLSGAAMGTWADYDNDGDLDLFVTHGQPEHVLYRNDGGGVLTRVRLPVVAEAGGFCVGTVFADFDNDGWLDLLIARRQAGQLLFHSTGDGGFEAVTTGPIANRATGANGVAVADYDLDGDLDVLLTNWQGAGSPTLFRNDTAGHGWLRVRLEGTRSNRAGIGARVRVRASIGGRTLWQLRQVGGEDAQGSQELIAHFGLGDATNVDLVRIEWPSGGVDELTNVRPRQVLTVSESAVTALGSPTLNRQTGLYEQRYSVPADPGSAFHQVRLRFPGLPAGVTLANASGSDTGGPYVQCDNPAASGQSVTLTVTFQQPRRAGFPSPAVEVTRGDWTGPAIPEGDRLEVTRTLPLPGGDILVEFPARRGERYTLEYSDDLAVWTPAATVITAGGTRVQWIDHGPPETRTAPSSTTRRFYRVIRLQPAQP